MSIQQNILEDIFAIEDQLNFEWKKENISLFEGKSGIALFYLKLYEFTNDKKYRDQFNLIIATILEEINDSDYNLGYCTGLSGTAFILNFFHQKNLLKDFDIEDGLKQIDSILFDWSYTNSKNIEDIDFLHGTLGAVYYLLNREHPKIDDIIFKICSIINEEIKNGINSFEENCKSPISPTIQN